MNNVEKILARIFLVMATVMFIYITGCSFLFSWVNNALADEKVYIVRDSLILNIVGIAIVLVCLFFQRKWLTKVDTINTKRFAILAAILSTVISLVWVLTSVTAPQSDQNAVCEAASMIAKGDYSYFEKGGYIAKYPHQLGIVTVMRVLFTVFGDYNYTAFKVLSALAVFAVVYFGYYLVGYLSSYNAVAEIVFLEIAFLCLPMYFYTDFVYGEILSIACMLASFVLIIEIYRKPTVLKYAALVCSVLFALVFRKNSIIMYVAALGVLVVKSFLGEKRKRILALILLVFVGIGINSVTVNALYGDKFGEGANGIPAILWISMGTNEEDGFAGWYNGSNLVISDECDYNVELETARAKEILAEFFTRCKNDPVFFVKFYMKKTTSQWCAPMFQGIVMNSKVVDSQTSVAKWIYNESNWKYLDGFMNIYQLFIYGGVLAFLMYSFKKVKGLEAYIGLICIFGGFLFSIIWEAKTRYVFPYFMLMLPYAAVGIENIVTMLANRSKRV